MKPYINKTGFGWIEIDGERYEHDILIRPDGEIKKRKKKLSKQIFGTSHTISLEEAKHILKKGGEKLIIGTGQSGLVDLSKEAEKYFKKNKCKVKLFRTPEATEEWNKTSGEVIGVFHLTC